MSLEIEAKFPCSNLLRVRQRLNHLGGKGNEGAFETNLVFDSKDNQLRTQHKLLRLRQSKDAEICLKRPPQEINNARDKVKVWEEYETKIQDSQNMIFILQELGFFVNFQYEKYREIWYINDCQVCLDILPFGKYVEIEGEQDSIYKTAEQLSLDKGSALTATYHDLNQEFRQAHDLSPNDSFVFDEPDRSHLIENGLNF